MSSDSSSPRGAGTVNDSSSVGILMGIDPNDNINLLTKVRHDHLLQVGFTLASVWVAAPRGRTVMGHAQAADRLLIRPATVARPAPLGQGRQIRT